MKKKSDVEFSPISCLPDDVVLAILNKVMDLKMLCFCGVVSKRFYAIVHQVDTIRVFLPISNWQRYFKSVIRFKKLKSVYVMIPEIPFSNEFDGVLFKWKVKMGLNRINSFVIVSPTSIYDKKGLLACEEKDNANKFKIVNCCLTDVLLRVQLLWLIIWNFDIPLLEKISVTDSDNRGKVSMNIDRETIDELRNLKSFSSFVPRLSECYLPSLELPLSGYVMKGVSLFLVENKDLPDDGNYDRLIKNDHEIDFNKHDKEEAAYHEAMVEIFKKHKGSIVRKPPNEEWEKSTSNFLEGIIHDLLGLRSIPVL